MASELIVSSSTQDILEHLRFALLGDNPSANVNLEIERLLRPTVTQIPSAIQTEQSQQQSNVSTQKSSLKDGIDMDGSKTMPAKVAFGLHIGLFGKFKQNTPKTLCKLASSKKKSTVEHETLIEILGKDDLNHSISQELQFDALERPRLPTLQRLFLKTQNQVKSTARNS
jgi:hypothetical protein